MTPTQRRTDPHRTPLPGALLLLLVLLVVPAFLGAQANITLRTLGGESMSEADLARGPTVVVVWASWSPRGRNVVEKVNAIEQHWGSRSRVVTVNFQEDASTVRDFLAGRNLTVPVLLDADGVFAKKHAVTSLPGLLVFQGGRVAYRGPLPDDPASVLNEILQ